MDWSRDGATLNDVNLTKVFRYASRNTTVLHVLRRNDYRASLWSLDSEKGWDRWLKDELPAIDGSETGLVLILAKRMGEPSLEGIDRTSSDDWLKYDDQQRPEPSNTAKIKKAQTFASNGEKPTSTHAIESVNTSGNQDVRKVPFDSTTFKSITNAFHIHGSIAKVVNRADVPLFSAEQVEMSGQPAYVYSSRSSHAWEMDMALTATYFPSCGLTFAILFGCPFSAEEDIVRRLRSVSVEAAHPMLVPGIFAEIESARHAQIVDKTVLRLEAKIFELEFQPEEADSQLLMSKERNEERRTAWLDTTYLRNGLMSQSTQLGYMAQHVEHLKAAVFSSRTGREQTGPRAFELVDESVGADNLKDEMCVVSDKIAGRIQVISGEYEARIRDCTMRVDGMAMATEWYQGETNFEIGVAMRRDSRHMRSIALLTMIFLPGTFLASVFSTTFFNWFGNDDSGSTVSSYFWIYIMITVIFTFLTVGLWYYFVVHPESKYKRVRDEEE